MDRSHQFRTWETLVVRCRSNGAEVDLKTGASNVSFNWGRDPDFAGPAGDDLQQTIRNYGTKPMLKDERWFCSDSGRQKIEAVCAKHRAGVPVSAWKHLEGKWWDE